MKTWNKIEQRLEKSLEENHNTLMKALKNIPKIEKSSMFMDKYHQNVSNVLKMYSKQFTDLTGSQSKYMGILHRSRKMIQKNHIQRQKTMNIKNNLNKNKGRDITRADFKICNRAVIIKTA